MNLHELRKRAITILPETRKMKFKNQKEFDKTVNESAWNEADGVAVVKN